ncbi:hypothetical protein diail_1196 [Diaporthe ilicicola]|nr:hypothetical protein diail_1196 [Diaporthe ilicicola]
MPPQTITARQIQVSLWGEFIRSQSHKRTLFAVHQIDALLYQFLSIPRSLSHLEIKHELPCPRRLLGRAVRCGVGISTVGNEAGHATGTARRGSPPHPVARARPQSRTRLKQDGMRSVLAGPRLIWVYP